MLRALISLVAVVAVALMALVLAGAAQPRHAPGHFPAACNPNSEIPGFRSFESSDAWRFSRAYRFPFSGWTPDGRGSVLWRPVAGVKPAKQYYPAPNLPSCRVGRFGTEDRATRKSGRHFMMLEPIDGGTSYDFRDSFDRHVATLTWSRTPPVAFHPSKWGWFFNGNWAGHGARRAFEIQGSACKLKAEALAGGGYRWVRDPDYVMVAFNPSLGLTHRAYAPRDTRRMRMRAFVDRRALPPGLLAEAETYDFGCGASNLPERTHGRPIAPVFFHSRFSKNLRDMQGYYFGEANQPLFVQPGGRHYFNHFPLKNYNSRPNLFHSVYAMASTTGIAAGGMVRALVRAHADRFALYDEMSYCDPNYTLRNMRLRRGHKRFKLSRFFPRANYSRFNRPAVRWRFGRIEPSKKTLTPEQAAAADNPASEQLFAWLPFRCDR